MTYQTRYKGFAFWLTAIVLMAFVLLAGVAQAGSIQDVSYTSDSVLPQFSPTPTYDPLLRISGKVTDENGNPLQGIEVFIGGGGSSYQVLTDAQGNYTKQGFHGGDFRVRISYQFIPYEQAVTIPPDAVVNFQRVAPTPTYTPTPQAPTPTFTPTNTPTSTPVTPTPITPTPVVSDSGFKLNEHAWSFKNENAYATWNAFKATYGADAVEWKVSGLSIRQEVAEDYYDQSYSKFGDGGMCYGMVTIAAHRFTDAIVLPDELSGEKVYDISAPYTFLGYWITNGVTNYIYQYHGYQKAREQLSAHVASLSRTMTETVSLLTESVDTKLKRPYGIGMYGGLGNNNYCYGHIVLPFAYSQTGDVVTFSVYDPNHPGQEGKVKINPKTDFWEFTSEPTWGWSSQQACVFEEDLQSYPDVLLSVTLGFDSHQATKPWGLVALGAADSNNSTIRQLYLNHTQRAFVQGGNSVFFLPYGVIPGEENNSPKLYLLDTGVPFSVTLNQVQTGESSITLFDRQAVVSVKGQATQGTVDTIAFSADASAFTVKTGESVTRSVTTITGDDTQQYQTDLYAITMNEGNQARFVVGNSGKVTITVGTDQSEGYQAHFVQAGVNGSSEFTLTMPSLAAGDSHLLQPNWTNNSVLVQTDQDSNGSIDTQEVIQTKTTLQVFLPLIKR